MAVSSDVLLMILGGILVAAGLGVVIYMVWARQHGIKRSRTDVSVTEPISFTAYYPKELISQEWAPLLVFATCDEAAIFEEMHDEAQRELAVWQQEHPKSEFRETIPAPGSRHIAHGELLRIVPRLEGFRINPPSATVAWEERWHKVPFRVMADEAQPGSAVNGSVQVLIGPLLLAEIPLSIYVNLAGDEHREGAMRTESVPAFRKIFASYSHADADVVLGCKSVGEALGDRYLLDVISLRSGEVWSKRLRQLIRQSDVFQLFWSERASHSQFVRDEWRQALSLRRPRFVRPVYWTEAPFEPIPDELQHLHFSRLDLQGLNERMQAVETTDKSTPHSDAPLGEISPTYSPTTWVTVTSPARLSRVGISTLAGVSTLFILLLCTSSLLVTMSQLGHLITWNTLPIAASTTIPMPTLAARTQYATIRPPVVVQFCNDTSASYPRSVFKRANQLMASSLQQAVTANQDGVTLYATAITHNTFDPANTLTFNVPAIPGYAPPPTPLPTFPPNDPITDPATATAVSQQTTKGILAYNGSVATIDQLIQKAQSSVKQDTGRLTTWNPMVDTAPISALGCFQLATSRFRGQSGVKMIYIASDLENNTDVDYTSDFVKNHSLEGVIVHAIFLFSTSAASDQAKRAQWCPFLQAAGATEVLFSDPNASLQSTNLFDDDLSAPKTTC